MKWQFNVPNGSNSITLNAEVIYTTHQVEKIKVTGKDLSVTFLGNRPLIEAIERPHPMPVSWRIISGEVNDAALFTKITQAVEKHVKQAGNKVVNNMYTEMKKTA